jgi:hypothetical protein
VCVETGQVEVPPTVVCDCAAESPDATHTGLQSLIIVPTAEDVAAIRLAWQKPAAGLTAVYLGEHRDTRTETPELQRAQIASSTPSRLIDHIRRGNLDISSVIRCVVLPPDGNARRFAADLHFIYTKFDRPPATVLFQEDASATPDSLADLLRRPITVSLVNPESAGSGSNNEPGEEIRGMSRDNLPFDARSASARLKEIVRRIHHDEDVTEMNQYKRFVKRNVSVFNRAYFTAYLVKQLLAGSSSGSAGDPDAGPETSANRTSIFVSAGRNRRVHAKDLVTLFTSVDGVSRDDIGQIKVLDNYSFVEVESSRSNEAIEALNGTEFRGRKLTVNFARRK